MNGNMVKVCIGGMLYNHYTVIADDEGYLQLPNVMDGKIIKSAKRDEGSIIIRFEDKSLVDYLTDLYEEIKTSGMAKSNDELDGINRAANIILKRIEKLKGGNNGK